MTGRVGYSLFYTSTYEAQQSGDHPYMLLILSERQLIKCVSIVGVARGLSDYSYGLEVYVLESIEYNSDGTLNQA